MNLRNTGAIMAAPNGRSRSDARTRRHASPRGRIEAQIRGAAGLETVKAIRVCAVAISCS